MLYNITKKKSHAQMIKPVSIRVQRSLARQENHRPSFDKTFWCSYFLCKDSHTTRERLESQEKEKWVLGSSHHNTTHFGSVKNHMKWECDEETWSLGVPRTTIRSYHHSYFFHLCLKSHTLFYTFSNIPPKIVDIKSLK